MSFQKVKQTLLIRPKPQTDESFQGYFYRLVCVNGYKINHLSKFVSSNSVRFRSFKEDDRTIIKKYIAEITGHDSVNKLFDPWQQHQKHKELFDYKRIKVCPSCLNIKPYTNYLWWFKNFLVCGKHDKNLIDKCSECLSPLTEQALVAMKCTHCNTPLAHMNAGIKQPDGLTLYIEEQLSAVKVDELESALDNILTRVIALKPYVRLIPGELFRTWYNPKQNQTSIKKLVDIQSSAMILFKNREHTKNALLDVILQNNDKLSISAKMRGFSSHLFHSGNSQFVNDLADTLLSQTNKLDSFSIELTWLEKVYGVERSKVRNILDSIDPSILNGKARLNSQYLYLLRDLLVNKSSGS